MTSQASPYREAAPQPNEPPPRNLKKFLLRLAVSLLVTYLVSLVAILLLVAKGRSANDEQFKQLTAIGEQTGAELQDRYIDADLGDACRAAVNEGDISSIVAYAADPAPNAKVAMPSLGEAHPSAPGKLRKAPPKGVNLTPKPSGAEPPSKVFTGIGPGEWDPGSVRFLRAPPKGEFKKGLSGVFYELLTEAPWSWKKTLDRETQRGIRIDGARYLIVSSVRIFGEPTMMSDKTYGGGEIMLSAAVVDIKRKTTVCEGKVFAELPSKMFTIKASDEHGIPLILSTVFEKTAREAPLGALCDRGGPRLCDAFENSRAYASGQAFMDKDSGDGAPPVTPD